MVPTGPLGADPLPADPLQPTFPCVVLCPPLGGGPVPDWFDECRTSVTAHGLIVVSPPPGVAAPAGSPDDSPVPWVAEVAAAIRTGSDGRPLLVVADGVTARALPALAVSQRAARQGIVGYVLVDVDVPTLDTLGGDWLGAPVTYVRTPGATELGWRVAQLHGWLCRESDPGSAVLEAAALAGGGFPGSAQKG